MVEWWELQMVEWWELQMVEWWELPLVGGMYGDQWMRAMYGCMPWERYGDSCNWERSVRD